MSHHTRRKIYHEARRARAEKEARDVSLARLDAQLLQAASVQSSQIGMLNDIAYDQGILLSFATLDRFQK